MKRLAERGLQAWCAVVAFGSLAAMISLAVLFVIAGVCAEPHPQPQPLPSKSAIRRVMREHRAEHPRCEVCGVASSFGPQWVYARYATNRVVVTNALRFVGGDGKRVPVAALLRFYGVEVVGKQLPVHHVKSQKPFPELAADPSNMRTLCPNCHRWLGHLGGRYKDHDTNLLVTMDAVRQAVSNNAVSYNATKGE